MSEQPTPLGLAKWQLALLVGVPVAVVVTAGAIWYLRSGPEEEEDEEHGSSSPSKGVESPKVEAEDTTDHMVGYF